ncbi:MAG: hypothetical protein NTW87_31095, partial [Planctomycetota bacterium]|nr:hypothetical protein [Planctomycetota bacterium]
MTQMERGFALTLFCGASIAAAGLLCAAEQGAPPTAPAPLGSADCQPSPERPIGWRGDGSGRYIGATPPVTFERTIVTPISGFRCQAKRPNADEVSGTVVSQYAGGYRITEWLVLGPVVPSNPAKPLDSAAVPNEAALAPDEGEAVGDLKWRRVESVGGVDFGEVFGEKPARKVAYALAYFRSEEAFRCAMGWEGHDLKQWLNGAPASGWGGEKHPIKKGWNRLLVKVVAPANQDAWAFKTCFSPHHEMDLAYSEKNIRWTRPLPALSWATPVIAGDRL